MMYGRLHQPTRVVLYIYMSYANHAATNQIPVSLCIFIDLIIILCIKLARHIQTHASHDLF